MSMISAQIDELRERAKELRNLAPDPDVPYLVPSTKETMALAMRSAAGEMEDAADTIWQLRDDLQRTNAENAKLRERARDLYCLAYPSTVEWEVSDETYDKYSPCEKCHELHGGKSPCASTAEDMTEECCAPIQANIVADCLRELGVEVE